MAAASPPTHCRHSADGAFLRARLAAARGRVRFQGLTAVRPGSVLKLSRLSDRFNGKVYVTGVRHEFSRNNWTTDAEFGLPRETHAERVAMSHLPAAGLAAAVHGLQVGVVTELAEDPGKEHRIRVKVPLAGMDEQGVWARVATLDAGNERGTLFRPEIDDEVVSVSSTTTRPSPSCSACFTAAPRRRRSSRPPTTTRRDTSRAARLRCGSTTRRRSPSWRRRAATA